ncbi:hypothetical protein [Streptomyces sp. NPDC048361]|uniref:hypothetical protein n=1 Tax=Streptomyces sp. NPDC048361 TaxID=3154720 RepID=UPI00343F19FB
MKLTVHQIPREAEGAAELPALPASPALEELRPPGAAPEGLPSSPPRPPPSKNSAHSLCICCPRA